jgi:hypothetical protein
MVEVRITTAGNVLYATFRGYCSIFLVIILEFKP